MTDDLTATENARDIALQWGADLERRYKEGLDAAWAETEAALPDGWLVGTDMGWGDHERFVLVAAEPNGHGGGLIRVQSWSDVCG